jgi:hypothetical protein
VITKEEALDPETKEVVDLDLEIIMGKIQIVILSPMVEEILIEIMGQ